MYKKGTLAYLIFAFCLGAMALLAADSPNDTTTTTDNTATTADTASPSSDPASAPAVEGPLSRWLQLNTLSFGMRYRNTSDFDGFHLFHFGQERSLIDGAVKLDAQGKYQIHFHASSGRYFNWAYADEIGGNFEVAPNSLARFHPNMLPLLGESVILDNAFFELTQKHLDSRGWQIYLRQLYASATPIKQITVEYGGLGIERGLNSEMTTYDDDGYMTGGRLRIKDPDHLFFDQLAATFGYLGDIYIPNIFDRGNRFLQSNYHQFLAEKKLKGHFDASVDYTEHFGTHTLREGILVNTAKSRMIDSVRGEFYQRTNDVVLQTIKFGGGSGWGFTGAKKIVKKWNVEGGFASVDKNYPVYTGSSFMCAVGHSINGDAYAIGNRLFGRASYKVALGTTLFGYYTHIVDTDFMTLNRQTVEGGIDLNLKEMINRKFNLF